VGGSSPIQRTNGPLRTKKLQRSESKSTKYIAHASTMPSIHADRCEPDDKTGTVRVGCEEEDDAIGGVHTGRYSRVWDFAVAQAARHMFRGTKEDTLPTTDTHTLVHTHTHTHTRTHTHTPHTLANSEQLSSRPMDGHRGIVELLVETLGKLRRCHLNGLAQPGKRRPTL